MPTNFPTSVDNFTNPTANDSLNLPSHSTQHANANDAIEAIEGYLLNGGQGLTLVKKQTIGTAVSSVTVTGAFSSRYENYKIVIAGGASSGSIPIAMQMGGTTTNYFSQYIYTNWDNSVLSDTGTARSSWVYAGSGSASGLSMDCDVLSPFLAKTTRCNAVGTGVLTSFNGFFSGMLNNTTSYTDLVIVANSGTMTGGTIYVYGYGIGQ